MFEAGGVRAGGEVRAVAAEGEDQGGADRPTVELRDLDARRVAEVVQQPAVVRRTVEAEALARIRRDEHLVQHVSVGLRRADTNRDSVTFGAPDIRPMALRERQP